MTTDDRLTRLRDAMGPDFVPVRPLAVPSVRVLWLLVPWGLLSGGVFLGLGFRPDLDALGLRAHAVLMLTQVVACLAVFHASLRWSIPGFAPSTSSATLLAVGAVLLHLGIAWDMVARSDLMSPTGGEWAAGLACLAVVTVSSVPSLIVGMTMLRRGVLTRVVPAVILTGLATGLMAESAWRLHCPYSGWGHVLPFHTGALLMPVLLAAGLAAWLRGREASSDTTLATPPWSRC